MALAITNLTANVSAADASSYNTASVSPAATSLILVSVIAYGAEPNSVTGGGLTFTRVNGSTLLDYYISTWRAMGSYTPGVVTIGFASERTYCAWSVEECTGVDTGGTNGSGAVVQSGNSVTSPITLSAFGSANNYAFGAYHAIDTLTVGSGFTQLGYVNQDGHYLQTEKKINDNTVDASSGGMGGGVALEIKEAAAAADPFGATGQVPTCTNPATAADGAWKDVGDVLATDYVPTVPNPAVSAGGAWQQVSALDSADFVPMVDDAVTPTAAAWTDGDERAIGEGEGGGSNEPTGMSVVTNRPCNANDETSTAAWSDDPRDVALQPTAASGWLTFKQPAGDKTTTLDPGVAYFSTGLDGNKTLYAKWKVKVSAGFKGHGPNGNNKFLYVYRDPGTNTLMAILEWVGSGDADLFPAFYLFGVTLAGYTEGTQLAANVNNPALPRNSQQEVELRIYLGTPNTADGTLEFWVAGVKTHNITGIKWRTTDVFVRYFQLCAISGGSGSWNIPSDQYVYHGGPIYVSAKA